jgi:hypothetical protein
LIHVGYCYSPLNEFQLAILKAIAMDKAVIFKLCEKNLENFWRSGTLMDTPLDKMARSLHGYVPSVV